MRRNVSAPRKVWDCYPWELGEPYAAFSAWLHAGPSRATPRMFAAMQGDARIEMWALNGLWEQRAALYDREVATREIVVRVPLFAGLAPRLLALVESRIRDLEAATAAGQIEAVSTRDMISLVRLLLSMQREAREVGAGIPTPTETEGSVDYSALSVDELRTFQELLAKASAAQEKARANLNLPRAESVFHVKHEGAH